jgi:DedD protein
VELDTVDSAAGSLHRVRVGPFVERPAAEQALDEMNRRFPDLKPRMVDLRPEDAAPVAQPSDPMVRWVVQVGSFSDSANADKLVYQLRDSGYRAASERVTSNGQQSYKVRVGPELQRESAVLLKDRIAREFGISGLVMSAE